MANDTFDKQRVTASTFLFEVDGVEIGRFMEVGGLEVTVAVEEIEEGGENNYVHKLPGRMTWPNITLKRGITQNDTLLDLAEQVVRRAVQRQRQQADPLDRGDHADRPGGAAAAGVGVRRRLPDQVEGPRLRRRLDRHGDGGAGDHAPWIPSQDAHLTPRRRRSGRRWRGASGRGSGSGARPPDAARPARWCAGRRRSGRRSGCRACGGGSSTDAAGRRMSTTSRCGPPIDYWPWADAADEPPAAGAAHSAAGRPRSARSPGSSPRRTPADVSGSGRAARAADRRHAPGHDRRRAAHQPGRHRRGAHGDARRHPAGAGGAGVAVGGVRGVGGVGGSAGRRVRRVRRVRRAAGSGCGPGARRPAARAPGPAPDARRRRPREPPPATSPSPLRTRRRAPEPARIRHGTHWTRPPSQSRPPARRDPHRPPPPASGVIRPNPPTGRESSRNPQHIPPRSTPPRRHRPRRRSRPAAHRTGRESSRNPQHIPPRSERRRSVDPAAPTAGPDPTRPANWAGIASESATHPAQIHDATPGAPTTTPPPRTSGPTQPGGNRPGNRNTSRPDPRRHAGSVDRHLHPTAAARDPTQPPTGRESSRKPRQHPAQIQDAGPATVPRTTTTDGRPAARSGPRSSPLPPAGDAEVATTTRPTGRDPNPPANLAGHRPRHRNTSDPDLAHQPGDRPPNDHHPARRHPATRRTNPHLRPRPNPAAQPDRHRPSHRNTAHPDRSPPARRPPNERPPPPPPTPPPRTDAPRHAQPPTDRHRPTRRPRLPATGEPSHAPDRTPGADSATDRRAAAGGADGRRAKRAPSARGRRHGRRAAERGGCVAGAREPMALATRTRGRRLDRRARWRRDDTTHAVMGRDERVGRRTAGVTRCTNSVVAAARGHRSCAARRARCVRRVRTSRGRSARQRRIPTPCGATRPSPCRGRRPT